jgi:uncharacterized protein
VRTFQIAVRAAAFLAAAAILAGCQSGPSGSSKRTINSMIASGDYAAAAQYIEKVKESQYGKKNMVLFYLDKGTVLHHQGRYEESDQAFDRAETRAEELYTKSISKASGMLLLNDTTVDYAGEPFERALTNVFRALNYVFLGKPDEALVESRKVESFLERLNTKLENKNVYKDDAFARYLDSLLYADAGKNDDARISMDAATKAYSWYTSLYRTPTPQFDIAKTPEDHGELVFIHYNGVAPRKVSKTWQIAWGQALATTRESGDLEANDDRFRNAIRAGFAGTAITVSYPDYVQDGFRIVDSEVQVDTIQAKASTLLMEDISAIAFRNLQDRMALIKTRAIARATVKYVIAESASRAAAAECDKRYGARSLKALGCRGLSRGLAHGTSAVTEIADTRGWGALPAQIRMARVKLPSGKHDVTVRFKDASGAVVTTRVFKDVIISPSKRTYLQHRTAI